MNDHSVNVYMYALHTEGLGVVYKWCVHVCVCDMFLCVCLQRESLTQRGSICLLTLEGLSGSTFSLRDASKVSSSRTLQKGQIGALSMELSYASYLLLLT